MTDSHLVLGKKGEQLAEVFLLKKGYKILRRNVRIGGRRKFIEVDLIAKQGDDIVFVEVKTRARDDGFNPSQRIDRAKIERLQKAAEMWLAEREEEYGARLDIIGVCEGKVVEHFEDVTG